MKVKTTALPAIAWAMTTASIAAQCTTGWLPVAGSGVGTIMASAAWDPDGPGPLPERLTTSQMATYDTVANAWLPLPQLPISLAGYSPPADALASGPNGRLFAAASGPAVNRLVYELVGGSWQALGNGVSIGGTQSGGISAMVVMPDSSLVIAGTFTLVDGVPASNLARWDGQAWQELGGGVDGLVWRLQALPGGGLLVAGGFTQVGGNPIGSAAIWDGSSWATLGVGAPTSVQASAVGDNGLLAVATRPPGATVWLRSGATWTSLGAVQGVVLKLAWLADGDLLATGFFSGIGGVAAENAARWDGTSWRAQSFANAATQGGFAELYDATTLTTGECFLVGSNLGDLGTFAPVLRLATSCAASATTFATGCAGAAGPNLLQANALPWVGGNYRATAHGMPANGLAVDVLGTAPTNMLLSTLLAEGLPGCALLVAPDSLGLLLPSAGRVEHSVAIPDTTALVGVTFRDQVIAFELDGAGQLSAVSSTNALLLTVGAL